MTAPAKPSPTAASTPPTTLVPPPKGMAAAPAPSHHEDRLEALALVAGGRPGREMVEAAAEGPDHVAVGLAGGVRCALVVVAAADGRKRARRREPRPRQLEVLEPWRRLDLGGREAEMLTRGARGLLDIGRRRLLILEAPAPELEAPLAHRRHGTGGRPLPGAHRHTALAAEARTPLALGLVALGGRRRQWRGRSHAHRVAVVAEAARPDPVDFRQHFDSRLIGPAGPNLGGFTDPDYDRRLNAANRLSGAERYLAFERATDAHLTRTGAPVAAFSNESQHSFFSERVGCQIHNPVSGINLAALCIRDEG